MRIFLAAIAVTLALQTPAQAWTRPGHVVSAAIAYDVLAARNPRALAKLTALAAQHPDRGPFEVAVGRETGEARSRRLFLELARWPDDVRGGPHDHATWHYALTPVVDPRDPPPAAPPAGISGAGLEAYALNIKVAGDVRATPAERATALAWIFHVTGDLHQPLHTAQLFSGRYPQGDKGGALEYVRDPQTREPIALHWFWDDSVNRSGEWAAADARARELMAKLPRSAFPELAAGPARPDQVAAWARESYALALPLAYRADMNGVADPAQAPDLPAAYQRDVVAAAERRLTLAGYRLADIAEALVAQD